MEIIDESEVKKPVKSINKKPTNKKLDKKPNKKLDKNKKPNKKIDKKPSILAKKLPGSPKDILFDKEMGCERTKKGMTNNCCLCQHTNNDIFIRCETKFTD